MEVMALTYIITIAIVLATLTTYTALQFTPSVPDVITEETCLNFMKQSEAGIRSLGRETEIHDY